MPKTNHWLATPAEDWDENPGYHGYGRVQTYRLYSVRLSVLKKQYEISRHKSQLEAAKAYDAALWRLLPFTPLCAKPNFPSDFDSITVEHVAKLCPFANELYVKLASEVEASGGSMESLWERRETKTASQPEKVRSRDPYAKLELKVDKLVVFLHHNVFNFSHAYHRLNLTKFPQLSEEICNLEKKLTEAFGDAVALKQRLEGNREAFKSLSPK